MKKIIIKTLLIVVVIIIAAMAYLMFATRDKIQRINNHPVSKAQIEISEIVEVLKLFHSDCKRFPTKEEGLAVLAPPMTLNCASQEPYLKKVPKDPWGNDFIYMPTDDGNFTIKSLGQDGKEGGVGFDTDISSTDQH